MENNRLFETQMPLSKNSKTYCGGIIINIIGVYQFMGSLGKSKNKPVKIELVPYLTKR